MAIGSTGPAKSKFIRWIAFLKIFIFYINRFIFNRRESLVKDSKYEACHLLDENTNKT